MKKQAIVLAAILTAFAVPAWPSVNGRRNTTLGLGAVTIYELATGKTMNGVIAGAGTAYAYSKYKDAKRQKQRHYIIVAPPGWHHGDKWDHHWHRVPPSFYGANPPGWHHGKKRGWHGHDLPPGQWGH